MKALKDLNTQEQPGIPRQAAHFRNYMKEKGNDGPGAAKYGPAVSIGKTFMGSLAPGRKFGSSFDENHKNAANISPGPAAYNVLKSAANISLKKPVYSIGSAYDSVHFD
jgi:hypothetical protein